MSGPAAYETGPLCPYGNPCPPEKVKAKYVVKAETSLQELSAKALLKPGTCRYLDSSRSTCPIYRCACPKFYWLYPKAGVKIDQFIDCLLRPGERIPDGVKDFILGIAKKMCEVHDLPWACQCNDCESDRSEAEWSTCSETDEDTTEEDDSDDSYKEFKEAEEFADKLFKMFPNYQW